ncbi:family 1 glycosylhydrolase [Arthrobacter sp. Cr_A7]|uniref:family 1 glycosylhydrolase n=1 Tax=Arthrobacter sp. Cr_A7 TaxID=3031017 RepID=UPI0023D9EE6A|nr:family 1 glycosylhydrolase [Arthrobacter sp. Cr_A7]MDF2050906.1 family 1 glycosylhydrolase [Arthrobacter sp. Cr_A7]
MSRAPNGPIELIGAFESTYLPRHDRDIVESTAHDVNWKQDLALLADCGVKRLRYPVRWHRVEAEEGVLNWADTDKVLHYLRDHGFRPIVDLVHHTSYPRWLEDGFADPRFRDAYLRYTEEFAKRYPWVQEYTLFNEPFSTLFLSGHEAIWPPYQNGLGNFVGQILNVLPAVAEASRAYAELLPGAKHVWVDTCEHHTGSGAGGTAYAAMANERRFLVLDSFLGRGYDLHGPLAEELRDVGGEALLDLEPGRIDVLGLDYYAHCQWHFADNGGHTHTPDPLPLADQIHLYWQRYRLPCMLTETNIRGHTSDRATWFKYVLEQCERARERGVPLEGLCWFPFIDSTDWNSLLFHNEGHIDPVGVYWLDKELDRRPSVMSETYARAAAGTPAVELPAYTLAEPVATWLRGYQPQMSHWTWTPAPGMDQGHSLPNTQTRMELRIVNAE